MACSRLLLLLLVFLANSGVTWAQVTIALTDAKDPAKAKIEVQQLPAESLASLGQLDRAELPQRLQVFVKASFDKGDQTSVLGAIALREKSIQFEPRFPLQPGIEYLVRFRDSSKSEWVTQVVRLPKKQLAPSTVVQQVYPTAAKLPQNLLKFYVVFSAPMQQGNVYQYIELQGADGKPIAFPFLEIAEELWDRSGQRLTLLLDPGRVKRGLVPREEAGPILVAGASYKLIIKATWPDAHGTPLAKAYSKSFTVVAEDFRQPDPATWKIKSPKSKTRDPMTFIMPESMDHATFARGVTIENEKGQIVFGEFTFSQEETQAHFTPLKDWRPGLYDVRILKRIEDLCGNSIERPFELDRFESTASSPNERTTLTVEVE